MFAHEQPAFDFFREVQKRFCNVVCLLDCFPRIKDVSMFQLRQYQEGAIAGCRQAYAKHQRVMLKSPTGSGKTEIAMAVVALARAKGKRVGFLCNRIKLVQQTSARFQRSGIAHGIIQGENTTRMYEPVLVASIQTVDRRGMPEVDLLIIDEAHGATSAAYEKLIVKHGGQVLGLSATPYSVGLGRHIEALGGPLFEDLVSAISVKELIEQGFLVDYQLYAPSSPDLSKIGVEKNEYGEDDYKKAAVAKAINTPKLVGDIVKTWLEKSFGKPTVCFAQNILHSKNIVKEFVTHGVAAEHIDCYTKEEERKAIFARIESGETLVVSNVGILTEGWDFPRCETCILACATKSLIKYLQMVGRVLRICEGKLFALILDHAGVSVLGYPDDDFSRSLDDGKPKEGGEPKEKEKATLESKTCQNCKLVKKMGERKCPVCGFESVAPSEIEWVAGDLVQKKKAKNSTEKPKTAKEYLVSLGKQTIYSMLLEVAPDYSKKNPEGWAAHKYRAIFDVWPRSLSKKKMPPDLRLVSWIISEKIKYQKAKK